MTNAELASAAKSGTFSKDKAVLDEVEAFRAACELAKIEPTARQASKWRARKGDAWEAAQHAKHKAQRQEILSGRGK